jgi:hypothetical protein
MHKKQYKEMKKGGVNFSPALPPVVVIEAVKAIKSGGGS